MQITYDKFNYPEFPYILLCNPNGDEIYSLGLAFDTKLTQRFNALSEFTFTFPESIDEDETSIEAYYYLNNKRLVKIENFGTFQITNVEEDLQGDVTVKKVTCQSLETELIQKRVVAYGGTVKLYDIISPEGTLLDSMIKLAPAWSIGTIDIDLLTTYRTFNVSDTNVYNFLMNDVETAFNCIFYFDTTNKIISAKSVDNATTPTDIFLSFDNVISKASFSEKSDEITTVLGVYGGGDLNIRLVNPLGTDQIYDFSYYKTTEWMTQDLIDAITNWETIVTTQQPIYANLLTQLSTYQSDLLSLQATLASLNSDLLSLQGVQATRIQDGLSYADINSQIIAKQSDITNQNSLISNKQGQINGTNASLQNINSLVSFSTNFTSNQLIELSNFMYENTYKNENIIQTDSMTLVDIQAAAQDLYNQAQGVLTKVSQPRYEIAMDSVNYVSIPDFSVFTSQTDLGTIVTAELHSGTYIETVLLELSITFTDPTKFTMTFSNRLRLDGANFIYSDLMGKVTNVGAKVSFDNLMWSNWNNDYKDSVTSFITSSLNTAVNNIINNDNQEILINQNGLRGRRFNGTGYDPTQVWLTNSTLAFSDDGFITAKLALGKLTINNTTYFGLVGDYVIGHILAGNSLSITNSGNNFTLDATGATLNNAKFTLSTTNTKVNIDPTTTNVFTIQKNIGGTFTNQFWVDNSGNVNFAGNLTGATGTFTGTLSASIGNIGTLVIDSLGLKTADGQNYLRGDGSLKWGGLSISGSNATFNGTIFANNISGQIQNNQVGSGLDAGKVTLGTMLGNRISGGTATLAAIAASSGTLQINNGDIVCGQGNLILGAGHAIRVGGNTGTTVNFGVTTQYGRAFLEFVGGVFVGYFYG